MVDPTNNIGPINNIQKSQSTQNKKDGVTGGDSAGASVPRVDEVSLSQEAIDLAEAQAASSEVRQTLSENPDLYLGLNGSQFSDQL